MAKNIWPYDTQIIIKNVLIKMSEKLLILCKIWNLFLFYGDIGWAIPPF